MGTSDDSCLINELKDGAEEYVIMFRDISKNWSKKCSTIFDLANQYKSASL